MRLFSSQQKYQYQALIILLLVAALVLVSSLYVVERAASYQWRLTQQPTEQTDSSGIAQQEQFHWKLITSWPKRFPGIGMAPENFAERVNQMSGGRLTITVFGAGEIAPALGVFDTVSNGSVEMGHTAAYYHKGKLPAAPFFTAVPFGMNAQETNAWFHHGGGMALWEELYEPFNLKPYAGGSTGVQMAGWFNKEINSIDDIKGLKMRIPGIAGEVFSRAGGASVTIPGGELYTSMDRGVIDATEWVGPYNDRTFGLHEVGKYYYYPGWHEPGAMLEFIVNKDALARLPKDLQAIIQVATRAVNQDMLDEYTARNANDLQILAEQYDIVPRPLPDEVVRHFRQTANEYYQELASTDPVFNKIYTAYQAFLEQVGAWHRISELPVLQSR